MDTEDSEEQGSRFIPASEDMMEAMRDAFDEEMAKKLLDVINTRMDCRAAQLGTLVRLCVATIACNAAPEDAMTCASSFAAMLLNGVINKFTLSEAELRAMGLDDDTEEVVHAPRRLN